MKRRANKYTRQWIQMQSFESFPHEQKDGSAEKRRMDGREVVNWCVVNAWPWIIGRLWLAEVRLTFQGPLVYLAIFYVVLYLTRLASVVFNSPLNLNF